MRYKENSYSLVCKFLKISQLITCGIERHPTPAYYPEKGNSILFLRYKYIQHQRSPIPVVIHHIG